MVGRFLVTFPGSSRDMIGRWWGAARAGLVNDAARAASGREGGDRGRGHAGVGPGGGRRRPRAVEPFRGVRLLPAFDPFTNELPRRTETVLPVAHHDDVYRTAGWVTPLVLVDGRIGGTWQLGGSAKRRASSTWSAGRRGNGPPPAELEAEVDRIAAFLDKPLAIEMTTADSTGAWPRRLHAEAELAHQPDVVAVLPVLDDPAVRRSGGG